jgi:DNA processing protein
MSASLIRVKDVYDRLTKDGLLISEYPLDVPPSPDNFPKRNRIVAALSHGLVVGEASSKRSGTLITVGYALGSHEGNRLCPLSGG